MSAEYEAEWRSKWLFGKSAAHCGYCGERLTIVHLSKTEEGQQEVPPPPGAKNMGRSKPITVHIAGRAECPGCGAKYRWKNYGGSYHEEGHLTWVTVSDQEYSR